MLKRIVVLLLLSVLLFADVAEQLKKDIAYLSSEVCFGRGYMNKGLKRAEQYIIKELRELDLEVKTQAVRMKMNVPVAKPYCVINGDTLRAGYDFIPHPHSGSVNTRFYAEDIDIYDADLLEQLKDSLELSSIAQVRRYLIKQASGEKDGRLYMFAQEDVLQSRQDKRFSRAALQVRSECVPDTMETLDYFHRTQYKRFRSNNVIARIEGGIEKDSVIMLTAHYDHMGALGDVYYPGANDNASGVAVLLALARHYVENPPPYTLVFCFFTAEEQGLLGSFKYAYNPRYPLENVATLVNLDMVGSGGKGFGMVNGTACPKEADILRGIAEEHALGELRIRDNNPNSDHYPFTQLDMNAFFLYSSGGEQPYHHPDDVAETLDWEVLEQTVLWVREFITRRALSAEQLITE